MPMVADNEPMPRKPKTPPTEAEAKPDAHLGSPFTMRLPVDLLAALDRLAEDSDRSRTGEIRLAIRKHLEAAGRWPPPTESTE